MSETGNRPAPRNPAGTSLTPAHNPRYANWARVNGRSPEAQLEQDRRAWPGGSMTGFALWNQDRLFEFSGVQPEAFYLGKIINHAAYDAWLNEWTPA